MEQRVDPDRGRGTGQGGLDLGQVTGLAVGRQAMGQVRPCIIQGAPERGPVVLGLVIADEVDRHGRRHRRQQHTECLGSVGALAAAVVCHAERAGPGQRVSDDAAELGEHVGHGAGQRVPLPLAVFVVFPILLHGIAWLDAVAAGHRHERGDKAAKGGGGAYKGGACHYSRAGKIFQAPCHYLPPPATVCCSLQMSDSDASSVASISDLEAEVELIADVVPVVNAEDHPC